MPPSPPEAPTRMESLSASGAALSDISVLSLRFLSQTIFPVSLSVAMTRPSRLVSEMTRLPNRGVARGGELVLSLTPPQYAGGPGGGRGGGGFPPPPPPRGGGLF